MTTITEYALMAGASYVSTRPDVNKFPVPDGWVESTEDRTTKPSGFEATYFTKGSEIVISYAGTDPGDLLGDWPTNLALAGGVIADQLRQAADYYLAVKANAPAGSTITFAGHSLGGGLASLMAVLFGETAYTFDQAPFRQSAQIFVDTDANGNQTSRSVAQRLRTYLTGRTTDMSALAKLDAFISANDPLNTTPPNPADTLAVRGGRVSNINVDGEFLTSWFLVPSSSRIGSQSNIDNSNEGAGGINVHSQALMAAFLQSEQTAPAESGQKKSFSNVTFKLKDLLRMVFDKNLFAFDTDKDKENFIERLVRHEAGNAPLPDGTTVTADAMLTRFTRDLWKLAQDGGLTMSDGNPDNPTFHQVSNALIAFAMQMYYEDTANATDANKELFTKITGGLQFDMSDVSADFKTALEANEELDKLRIALNKAKGFEQYFKQYLSQPGTFTPEESGLISTFLPAMRDWYAQAGAEGMSVTDSKNRGAFMLGGNGADTLTGGTAADLLVGNAGEDILDGGAGNDILLGCVGNDTLKGGDGVDFLLGGSGNDTLDGGADNDILKGGEGNDTYIFTGTYGTDIITDSDGQGSIKVGGQTLGSATQTAESIYKSTTSGQTLVRLNGGKSLVILKEGEANRILINDWSAGKALGITLQDTTPTAPATTLDGDFKKATDGDNYVIVNGNYASAGVEANAQDLISGTDGNDVIDGKGGDDALSGRAGDDYLIGGDGGDQLQGGMGKDTLTGGAGDDVIYGSSDDAIIKPTKTDFTRPVNNYANPQATGFNWTAGYSATYANGTPSGYSDAPRNRLADDQGNNIDGGTGNDFIAAGTGADNVHGGADNDLIYGMDKADILFGDGGHDVIYGDGNMPNGSSVVWTLPENHGSDIIDGGDGNDYLIGQGGSDILYGGIDNDKLWGDDDEAKLPVAYHGNDFLFGGAGKDELMGGAGNDYLEGGTGDDTLWGGAGNDVYFFNVGDGVDTLYDNKGEKNIIRFGAGVDASKIKLRIGSLMLDLGDGDAVHIGDFNQNDVFNSSSIGSFEFADGSTLSTTELLARGFDLDGTSGDDIIHGTNTTDRINGLAGNDRLVAYGGNDTLDGGQGADVMYGGEGNDTYVFNNGDGQAGTDLILDGQGNDVAVFNGVSLSQITLSHTSGGLNLQYGSTDTVRIADGLLGGIKTYQFADGTLSWHELANRYLDTSVYANYGTPIHGLAGGRQNDTLTALGGGTTFAGGQGNDTLTSAGGNNVFLYGRGDGSDRIVDLRTTADGAGPNTLKFGEGISREELSVSVEDGVLLLRLGTAGDAANDCNYDLERNAA